MLVLLTEEQLLPSQSVCPSCVLADHQGQPRWHQGELCCGRLLNSSTEEHPPQYQCQMGFRVANVE